MDDTEILPTLDSLFDEQAAAREGKPHISCDMWGSCTPRNISKKIRRTACLKPLHRELLRQFVNICTNAGIEAFVYGGTALGVYREGGRMIAFDYDADFATFEYSSDGEVGSLSCLANFCLSEGSNAKVINIEGLMHNPPADATVYVDFQNVFEPSAPWFSLNTEGKVIEKVFNGVGAKRAKFYFTHHGLQEAAKRIGQVKASVLNEVSKDLTDIHIDLFTLSPHPDSPDENLRVNWHRGGLYNSLNKMFSTRHFLPLQKVIFEGVEVFAPANLEGYLKEEYGYLGRDAMYDCSTQCYVKIPEEFRESLPPNYKKYINGDPL
ncbi:unnamed protein product [Rodentolepis nana]|uniref:LicD family protein n=1 Tax=Rodentolepis nana TaxID=102285 RepID=A0A0R3T236_RODNA|nr:unnamed protein product [Rodentolepis nana]